MTLEIAVLRILFLNRCYHPDVEATGQLLGELTADLARRHEVTVIAGQPNFVQTNDRGSWFEEEIYESVRVIRVRNYRFTKKSFIGRVVGLLSYVVLAFGAALFGIRPDVIVVETDPPVLGALGVILKRWHRSRLICYLQDLYPEVGLIMGRLRPGLMTASLKWATQFGLKHADRIIVLGEDMKERVAARGIDRQAMTIIPNWVDTSRVRPLKDDNVLRRAWQLQDRMAVMYSGNLGLSQNLEAVLEAARRLQGEPIQFLFVGEGAGKAHLMTQAKEWALTNVQFEPYQPKDRLGESLSAADLQLIPLRKGLSGYIVPSKLYGILAAGTPYLAAVDAFSEVARITRDCQAGILVEPDSADELVKGLIWCLKHPKELRAMGLRGRSYAEEWFDRRVAVAKFARLLEDLRTPFGPAFHRSQSSRQQLTST